MCVRVCVRVCVCVCVCVSVCVLVNRLELFSATYVIDGLEGLAVYRCVVSEQFLHYVSHFFHLKGHVTHVLGSGKEGVCVCVCICITCQLFQQLVLEVDACQTEVHWEQTPHD